MPVGDFLAGLFEFLGKRTQRTIEVVLFGTWLVVSLFFIAPLYARSFAELWLVSLAIAVAPVLLLKFIVGLLLLAALFALKTAPTNAFTIELPTSVVQQRVVKCFIDRALAYHSLENWALGFIAKPVFRAIGARFQNLFFHREPFVAIYFTPVGGGTRVYIAAASTHQANSLARIFEGRIKFG